jgi:hypothetical protein
VDGVTEPRARHRIELKLTTIEQLFNSMDPSPFHEKDLDREAEEFLVSWVQEFSPRDPVSLVIHLERGEEDHQAQGRVQQAIHHYFGYRAKLSQRELGRLMSQGRTSLIIGLVFLLGCFGVRELLAGLGGGAIVSFAHESVLIAGWVAMWRPMEIYLYEWWPIRRRVMIYRKMSHMPVSVHLHPHPAEGTLTPSGSTR